MTIEPDFGDLAVSAALFAVVVVLSLVEGLGLTRSLIVASLRMALQLTFMGLVIHSLFTVDKWYIIAVVFLAMIFYAARAGLARMKKQPPGLYFPMWTGVVSGTLFTTAVVTGAVLRIDPWYRPDVLIPLGGMILGNAMNGGSLAADRLYMEIKSRRMEIETLLLLGWDYKKSARSARTEAIRAALIPTINTMMTVGLVHIPGVMTGQMLGGASPLVAAKYQIIIMFMVASSVTVTSVVFTRLALGRYFTPNQGLKHELFD